MDSEHYIYRLTSTRPDMITGEPTAREAAVIDEHFAYLERLSETGVVLLAGRTLNRDESAFGIVLFRADSPARAEAVDPAVREGVMKARLYPYCIALLGKALRTL
jgi:uncharacterized protein YciI